MHSSLELGMFLDLLATSSSFVIGDKSISLIMFTPTTVCAPRRKSLLRAGLQGFRSEIGYQIFYQGLK